MSIVRQVVISYATRLDVVQLPSVRS